MTKPLTRQTSPLLFHIAEGARKEGLNPGLRGDCTNLRGDCTGLSGAGL